MMILWMAYSCIYVIMHWCVVGDQINSCENEIIIITNPPLHRRVMKQELNFDTDYICVLDGFTQCSMLDA